MRWIPSWLAWAAGGIAVALLILAGMHACGMAFYGVNGESMYPTFDPGDLLIVHALEHAPQRGQVVIIRPPAGQTEPFIKRVIGLPGDEIALVGGAVMVNGTAISEPYLAGAMATEAAGDDNSTWMLGPNEVFVLGDNRIGSNDSRGLGPFSASAIEGEPLFRYWPLDRLGTVQGP